MENNLEFIPIIREAWQVLKKNFLEIFLALLVFVALVYIIPNLVKLPLSGILNGKQDNLSALGIFLIISFSLSFVFFIIKLFATVGLLKIYLQSIDGEHPDFHYFYKHWKIALILFVNDLVMGFVSLGVVLGLFVFGLLIAGIPGFIVYSLSHSVGAGIGVGVLLAMIPFALFIGYCVILSFVQYVSVDKVWGPIDAIERVFAITKGKRIKLAFYSFGLMLFGISGIFLLIVGVILTGMISAVAFAVLYRKLDKMTPVGHEIKSYA